MSSTTQKPLFVLMAYYQEHDTEPANEFIALFKDRKDAQLQGEKIVKEQSYLNFTIEVATPK